MSGLWLGVVWLILMIGVFYVLLWRPQQRRVAAVRALQRELHEGDEVVTTSGIYGRIVTLADDTLELEVAPSMVMKVARGAIGQNLSGDTFDDFDIDATDEESD